MAEASISVAQDQFRCPICLDILKDAVTIPCGHSYCMGCIKDYWDQDDYTGLFRCPQCRQVFAPRPVLGRNNMLAEVVEKLKNTGLHAAPAARCYAGPGDVECDVCTGTKGKAVKSCLVCLASYCDTHLQPHCDSPALRKHKLIDATGQLQNKICSHHDKLLEVFCRSDQQCICYLCTMDEHRGHDTVSASAERAEKLKQLQVSLRESRQKIQAREKELKRLRQAVVSLTRSAQEAVEDSERIFTELIRSIERRRCEVKELIRAQEKAAVGQAEGLLKRLGKEISELRRRDAELDQISQTEDDIKFLQSCQFICPPLGSGDLPTFTPSPHCSFRDVKKDVYDLKEQLEEVLKEGLFKLCPTVREVHIVEPRNREEFLQHACELTLDSNTAHRRLCLSEGSRTVTWMRTQESYPDHPDRFDSCEQVLCREGLSGCCYWEAEWNGLGVSVAVSYKTINRKARGNCCLFGGNDVSWRFSISSFCHNNISTVVPVPRSSRIGVYLDHRAGTLSFYSVSDTMTLLHRVQTTFTQPLYPGFFVGPASSVKLCRLSATEAQHGLF